MVLGGTAHEGVWESATAARWVEDGTRIWPTVRERVFHVKPRRTAGLAACGAGGNVEVFAQGRGRSTRRALTSQPRQRPRRPREPAIDHTATRSWGAAVHVCSRVGEVGGLPGQHAVPRRWAVRGFCATRPTPGEWSPDLLGQRDHLTVGGGRITLPGATAHPWVRRVARRDVAHRDPGTGPARFCLRGRLARSPHLCASRGTCEHCELGTVVRAVLRSANAGPHRGPEPCARRPEFDDAEPTLPRSGPCRWCRGAQPSRRTEVRNREAASLGPEPRVSSAEIRSRRVMLRSGIASASCSLRKGESVASRS